MRVIHKLHLAPTNLAGCIAIALVFVVLAIASAVLVYPGFERPILDLCDRWVPARQAPAPAVAVG